MVNNMNVVERIKNEFGVCVEALEACLLSTEIDEISNMLSSMESEDFASKPDNEWKCTFVVDERYWANIGIDRMFERTTDIIKDAYPWLDVAYFVDGSDSYFKINDNDIFEDLINGNVNPEKIRQIVNCEQFRNMNIDYIVEISQNDDLLNEFLDSFKKGNDFSWYRNEEELSKDKYKAYKDGDNNTIYAKMSDDVIIELDK